MRLRSSEYFFESRKQPRFYRDVLAILLQEAVLQRGELKGVAVRKCDSQQRRRAV
jgi:hypothetical protein